MIKKLIKRFCTREIITYGIAGLLTTAVNLIAAYVMFNMLGIEENTTTIAAWIIAVIFAYFINAYWVFEHKYVGIRDEAVKLGSFSLSRIFTLIVEEGGILLFCTYLGFGYWLVKIPLAVIVIILNYVFSKLLVFVKKKK